jgi:hypothetical protein
MNKKIKIFVFSACMILIALALPVLGEKDDRTGMSPAVQKIKDPTDKSAKSGFGIGLRIHGGLDFFDGGDINDTRSNLTLNEYLAGQAGIPYTLEENELHRSLEGGGNLLLYLGKRLGIALGAAYLSASSDNRLAISLPSLPPATYTITFNPAVSAMPVTAGLFFILPLGGRLDLLAEAGGGWTLARLAIDQAFSGDFGSMQFNARGEAGGPCAYARLGLEFRVSRGIFFFIEALGRYARVSGFQGSAEILQNDVIISSGDGRFYTYDQDFSGHTIPFIDFADEPPSGPSVSNVGETQIDFSGACARGGLRIRF